jgi:O-antigen chain-terminating methyltransferase
VSPDYAVVAQKNASPVIQSKCDHPFNAEYGVSATTLASRYSAQQNEKFESIHNELLSIYSSYSWRITGPLRWVGSQYRKLKHDGLLSRLMALFKKILLKIPGVSQVIRNRDNSIRKLIISISHRVGCYSFMRRIFLFIRGGASNSHSSDNQMDVSKPQASDDLSVSAQKIYTTLRNRSSKSEEKSKQ